MTAGVAVRSRGVDEAHPRVSRGWRRMRILSAAPYYHPTPGGGGLYVKEVSERLARRGHEVAVLALQTALADGRRHGRLTREVLDGVSVTRVSPGFWLANLFDRVAHLPGGYRALHAVFGTDHLRMVTREPFFPSAVGRMVAMRPEVIAVTNWYHPVPAYHAMIAARFGRARVMGVPFFHTEETWSSSSVYRWLLRRCDAVVVMTEHERRFVARLAPEQSRVQVIGAGVEPARFVHRNGVGMRARYGLGDDPVVGCVGRIATNKGVVALIEAMRLVWVAKPSVRMLLAGSRELAGARSTRLIDEALAALPDWQRGRVVDSGPFEEAAKAGLFDACDVFAMPSRAESFGISYVEAWMCRKPVIGGRIGATACVIEDGVDGILVEPEDPRGIAEAILRLLGNPRERRAMGEAGYRKVMVRYTWDRVTSAIEALCLTMLSEKPGGRDSPDGAREAPA